MRRFVRESQISLQKYKTHLAWRKFKVILTTLSKAVYKSERLYGNSFSSIIYRFLIILFILTFCVDRESAEKLAKVVESACVLLADYNGRLSAELEDRTAVCKMLRAYLSSQQKKVTDCDQRIEVWN